MKVECIASEEYIIRLDSHYLRVYFWSDDEVFVAQGGESAKKMSAQAAFEAIIEEHQKNEHVQCLFGEWYAKDGAEKIGPFKTREEACQSLKKRTV